MKGNLAKIAFHVIRACGVNNMHKCKEECFHLGVKALIIDAERKVLLLERDHPVKGMYWDIPGGRLQKGESQRETLLREVKEETGLTHFSEIYPLMMTLTDIRIPAHDGDVGLIFSVFMIPVSASFDPVLSEEHTHFQWCILQEAADKLKAHYPDDFIKKLLELDLEEAR